MPAPRLTIAHVLLSLSVGGGERLALLLAAHQAAAGHRVLAVTFEEPPAGPLGEEFLDAGVEVRRIPKRRHGLDRALYPHLTAFFRRERITVVHAHNPVPLIYGALPARLAGARLVYTHHGPNPTTPRRLVLRRAAGRLAHAYVAVSEDTREAALANREVDPGKLSVLINATDTARFHPDVARRRAVRAAWGLGDDAVVVGSVGRLAAEKNHVLLIDALAPRLGPTMRLVLAGDGAEREAIAARAAALGVGDFVHRLGMVRDVPGVLNGFDVFALSSAWEGLPLVLVEAMATSLPVVATAVGGVVNVVVEGETGTLVPAGDVAAMRAALARLCDDPERRAAWGAAGRRRAERDYSVARLAAEYMDHYRVNSA
ncbi:MAG: glycosyltransferase [Myxococcota bacterium]